MKTALLYLCFKHGETEAQEGKVPCPPSRSQPVAKLGLCTWALRHPIPCTALFSCAGRLWARGSKWEAGACLHGCCIGAVGRAGKMGDSEIHLMGLDLKNMMQEVHWSHNAWQRVSTLHTTHREETKTQKTPVDHTGGIWPENKCCYASLHTCLPETQLETHQTSRILFKCKIFMEICHRDCQQIFSGDYLVYISKLCKTHMQKFQNCNTTKGVKFFSFFKWKDPQWSGKVLGSLLI